MPTLIPLPPPLLLLFVPQLLVLLLPCSGTFFFPLFFDYIFLLPVTVWGLLGLREKKILDTSVQFTVEI